MTDPAFWVSPTLDEPNVFFRLSIAGDKRITLDGERSVEERRGGSETEVAVVANGGGPVAGAMLLSNLSGT